MSITLHNVQTEFFSNVNLKLEKNEKIAIIGENGVGKTTLLRTILGLVKSSGDIKILDNDLKRKKDFKKIYPHIGYLFQDSDDSFITSSVLEEIAFNLYNKSEDYEASYSKALELLNEFEIEHLKDKLPIKLSGGQKRIVAICACIVHQPEILLLDEPTNHLDARLANLVEEKIKNYEGSVVLIAHNIDFAKNIVDKFYELSEDGLKEVSV